ncbi:CX domain containing protein [Trichuris trichiura]|uniref:CX domain containing protein n=1 Tax=Trichuris trichiura TaxID=36087 RepID=A0A077Z7W9_TRITR|nr:CX domain containing protein [Trichuris trichiura]
MDEVPPMDELLRTENQKLGLHTTRQLLNIPHPLKRGVGKHRLQCSAHKNSLFKYMPIRGCGFRGSTTKSILAGLAAGYVGYKATKGISRLMHNGIRYYPASSYYSDYNPSYSQPSTYSSTPMVRVRCEYDLPEDEMNMVNITMSNGARATKLIYECCHFHSLMQFLNYNFVADATSIRKYAAGWNAAPNQ